MTNVCWIRHKSKTSDIECNFSVELTFEYSLLPVGGNFSQIKRRSAQILLRNKYYGQIIFEFVFYFLTPYDFTIFSTSYFTRTSSRINVSWNRRSMNCQMRLHTNNLTRTNFMTVLIVRKMYAGKSLPIKTLAIQQVSTSIISKQKWI